MVLLQNLSQPPGTIFTAANMSESANEPLFATRIGTQIFGSSMHHISSHEEFVCSSMDKAQCDGRGKTTQVHLFLETLADFCPPADMEPL